MSESHPLPESGFSGKNLKDFVKLIDVESYQVAEWTPSPNGLGKSEQIHILFSLGGPLDGVTFSIRLKSKGETNRLIKALERHRDNVWS